MALTIPDEHHPILREWLKKGQAEADAIIAALGGAESSLRLEDLIPPLTDAGMAPSDAAMLLGVFASMVLSERNLPSRERFAAEIYEAVTEKQFDSLKAGEKARIVARVHSVLGLVPLQTTAKAPMVRSENQRNFVETRIISDLRFVFGDDVARPSGAMVVHQLRITYRTGADGRTESIYVAMDRDDLAQLQHVVGRALAKDVALRDVVKGTGAVDLEHPDDTKEDRS